MVLLPFSNELYFERVHQVSPNIHRQKYFAWVEQKQPTMGQLALQYAMWALASAVSAQFQPLSSTLCAASRQILEQMEIDPSRDDKETGIEHIQAWLLIAHRELLCSHEQQAMLTAGRAIRMVQLARLHDIDAVIGSYMPASEESMSNQRFIDAEERRRTFWLAYCFDRFCLMHNDCPPSLRDDLVSQHHELSNLSWALFPFIRCAWTWLILVQIRTRLPAPEENFQNGQHVQMKFLSDALAHHDQIFLPPFARCVVLNSLFAQFILHQRFFISGTSTVSNDKHKVWSKYAWLALALEKRKPPLLPRASATADLAVDTMTLFNTALVACAAATVYHCMARSTDWKKGEDTDDIRPYAEQAVQAVQELGDFVSASFRSMNPFKAHPFLPTVLYRSVLLLAGISKSSSSVACKVNSRTDEIRIFVGALRSLALVNNLSRSLLSKLEEDCLYAKLMESSL